MLVVSTVAVGLMAGFYYSYACSVMLGLGRTDDRTFLSAMQAINASVRNAAFAPAFFGSLVLTVAAAIIMVARRRSGTPWVVLAAVLYAASFVVTLTLNVPLGKLEPTAHIAGHRLPAGIGCGAPQHRNRTRRAGGIPIRGYAEASSMSAGRID